MKDEIAAGPTPKTVFMVNGLEWSREAIVLAAAMRKCGLTTLTLTQDELVPEGGLFFHSNPHNGDITVLIHKGEATK